MPTLEEAEAAFGSWRASKTKKHEKIPENLVEMARVLVAEHGAETVCKRLKIQAARLLPKEERPSGKFIEVPQVTPPQFSVVTIRLRLSGKKEVVVTMPSDNSVAVADLIKRISKL